MHFLFAREKRKEKPPEKKRRCHERHVISFQLNKKRKLRRKREGKGEKKGGNCRAPISLVPVRFMTSIIAGRRRGKRMEGGEEGKKKRRKMADSCYSSSPVIASPEPVFCEGEGKEREKKKRRGGRKRVVAPSFSALGEERGVSEEGKKRRERGKT